MVQCVLSRPFSQKHTRLPSAPRRSIRRLKARKAVPSERRRLRGSHMLLSHSAFVVSPTFFFGGPFCAAACRRRSKDKRGFQTAAQHRAELSGLEPTVFARQPGYLRLRLTASTSGFQGLRRKTGSTSILCGTARSCFDSSRLRQRSKDILTGMSHVS